MSEAGAPQGVPGLVTSSAGSARRGPLAGRRILLPRVKRKDALAGLVGLPPASTRVVALGHPTAASAGEAGYVVDVVADSPTPPGIRAAAIAAIAAPSA